MLLHRARLFIATVSISLALVACGYAPNEEASSNRTYSDIEETEESQESNSNETTLNSAETESERDDTETESSEATTSKLVNTSNSEGINPQFKVAVDKFISVTGLDIEQYSFTFEESEEEYIQITVHEKTEGDQTHSPLVGVYRYMLGKDEVLVQDYLTGAFIPFEEAEE